MKWMMFVLVVFAVSVCVTPTEAQITVDLDKAGDAFEILYEQEATVISITSWTGIGGAKLVLDSGQWPEQVVIRLNLSNLESFGMTNGVIRTNTSIRAPRRIPYWKLSSNQPRPDGVLECVVSRTEDAVEVTLPKEILEGDPEAVKLKWIDSFRN